jgi:hypothetical protein
MLNGSMEIFQELQTICEDNDFKVEDKENNIIYYSFPYMLNGPSLI